MKGISAMALKDGREYESVSTSVELGASVECRWRGPERHLVLMY